MVKITKVKLNSRTNKCKISFIQNNQEEESIIHFDIVLKYSLGNNVEIEDYTFELLLSDNDLLFAKNYAYNFVSYKPRTKKEIINKLKLKDYDDEIITKVIDFLIEFNLIDDEKFALIYCKEKAIYKSWGKYRIKSELLNKGIPDELIANALNNAYPEEDKYQIALESARKKYNQIKYKNDPQKIRNSIISLLQRNGFEYDIIKEVVKDILA